MHFPEMSWLLNAELIQASMNSELKHDMDATPNPITLQYQTDKSHID